MWVYMYMYTYMYMFKICIIQYSISGFTFMQDTDLEKITTDSNNK